MKKKIVLVLIILAMTMTAMTCIAYAQTINKTLNFAAGEVYAGQNTKHVTCIDKAYPNQPKANKNWIIATKVGGHSHAVKIRVQDNYGKKRTGTVTFTDSKGNKYNITVVQAKKDK